MLPSHTSLSFILVTHWSLFTLMYCKLEYDIIYKPQTLQTAAVTILCITLKQVSFLVCHTVCLYLHLFSFLRTCVSAAAGQSV